MGEAYATVKRPLLKKLFFSSTDILTLGKGNMGIKIAIIQMKKDQLSEEMLQKLNT